MKTNLCVYRCVQDVRRYIQMDCQINVTRLNMRQYVSSWHQTKSHVSYKSLKQGMEGLSKSIVNATEFWVRNQTMSLVDFIMISWYQTNVEKLNIKWIHSLPCGWTKYYPKNCCYVVWPWPLSIFSRGKWNPSTGQPFPCCLTLCGTDWYSVLLISFTTHDATAFDIIIIHIEQGRTNFLSHDGDSLLHHSKKEYFLYCKLQGPQSSYVTHTWLTTTL